MDVPFLWRRRWDSNPRAREGKRISSAPRYDHFDTSPDMKLFYMSALTNLAKEIFKANIRAKQAKVS